MTPCKGLHQRFATRRLDTRNCLQCNIQFTHLPHEVCKVCEVWTASNQEVWHERHVCRCRFWAAGWIHVEVSVSDWKMQLKHVSCVDALPVHPALKTWSCSSSLTQSREEKSGRNSWLSLEVILLDYFFFLGADTSWSFCRKSGCLTKQKLWPIITHNTATCQFYTSDLTWPYN